jgi:two-component system, sensor histidine kinase
VNAVEKGLDFQIKSEVPQGALFLTDPLRLKQILTNVIGNAIKFTDTGHVWVTLTIEADPKSTAHRNLRFLVEDTGIGLRPDEADRLFQPFMQADSSTHRRFGGTGLGLAIARQLTDSLGGYLVLKDSKLGVGSLFEVVIRVGYRTTEVAKNSSVSAKGPDGSEVNKLSGKSVLVVDDVIDNRILIERYLRPAGLKVGLATGGQEAIEMVKQSPWDAILMDIQMPQMDGYETTKILRDSGFSKPIIALTAHAMAEELNRCLKAGCNDTLTKPTTKANLIRKLAEVIA